MSRQQNYIFNGSFFWMNPKGEVKSIVPSKILMVEDINDFSRTFVMDFLDDSGINEFIGLWKRQEDQIITYGNYLAEEKALDVCVVRIQDVKISNIYTEDVKWKGIRVKCVEVIDNFLTTGFKTKKGWKNKTAQDIFKDIFANMGEGYEIVAPEYKKTHKIPLLLNPYWSKGKLLKYVLTNYVTGGPGKVIISYENEGKNINSVKIGMYPLQHLMQGGLGKGPDLKVEPDDTNANGIKPDYFIYGPSRMDRVYKDYKDQAYYVFNNMKGIDYNTDNMDTFESSVIGPEFDNNDERGYANPFFTTVSKNAEVTPKLGRILHEKDTNKGISTTNMNIDCEPKPIVQQRALSKFYQYHSQNFVMECTVAPSKLLKIGKVYYIRLPSRNQQNSFGIEDSTLSGEWLLSRIEHDFYQEGERYEYRPKCFFIRTGLEKAPSGGLPANEAVDKELGDAKENSNETAKDKLSNMKNKSKNLIKGAKGLTNVAKSATSGIGSNSANSSTPTASTSSNSASSSTTQPITGTIGTDNVSSNIGGSSVNVVSTKLVSGKSAVGGVQSKTNIVDSATQANSTELSKPSGDVKTIDGTMTVDGKEGKVNGIVKGNIQDGEINNTDMIANYDDGSGNKIVSGKVDGYYDAKTTSVTGTFKGEVIEDRTDDEIQQGNRDGDELIKRWWHK